ncbi:U3 snoRNP-associated protein (contains WD40 repeats) [Ceraceosorus bombacis]|uniref:U3 snoRNP-associated protein (Contains WD40 repeats) n=1 Tax=Ceraceosorus bombacis TaxID=401625 RepID=A0A0P1BKS2_9BASI|nr:U3 snoRNP-associated protein (contains WD40 repeats) [Ceraceosorus bombacis]
MPDPFFERKRKRPSSKGEGSGSAGSGKRADASKTKLRLNGKKRRNEGSASESSDGGEAVGDAETMDLRHSYTHAMGSASEDEMEETPAQARVRLAKLYVDGMKKDLGGDETGADAAQADAENISSRLLGVAQSRSSHVNIRVAQLIKPPRADDVLGVRGHQKSVTCAALSLRGDSIFTSSKDGVICRWGLADGKLVSRSELRPRHSSQTSDARSSSRNKTHIQLSSRSGAGRKRARKAMSSGSLEEAGRSARPALGGTSASMLGEKEGHTDEIWSLALSDDGTLLASGGRDRRVGLWAIEPRADARELSDVASSRQTLTAAPRWVAGLSGHKDSVTSLSFRVGSGLTELFSASLDRTLKLWDATQRSYIETFFGHQESCLSVSALRGELAASAGGRDKTIRWWKVRDESQLVFRAGARSKVREVIEGGNWRREEEEKKSEGSVFVEGSVDCVAMVDEHNFISGGDSGVISLWSLARKKPTYTHFAAHGFDELPTSSSGDAASADGDEDDASAARSTTRQPRPITSVAALPYADVFASGSHDGNIRLWALDASLRKFTALFSIPALGFVNSLQLARPRILPEANSWRRRGGVGASLESSSLGSETIDEDDVAGVSTSKKRPQRDIVLVAALGQEPKFGRWASIKRTSASKRAAAQNVVRGLTEDAQQLNGTLADTSTGLDAASTSARVRNGALVVRLRVATPTDVTAE